MESYEVNQKTSEEELSLEDQLAQQEAAKESEGQPPSGLKEEEQQQQEDLILGKFKFC